MANQVTVRLDTRPLVALIRAMPGRTRVIVRRNALLVRARARAQAHVITGSMRDSVYMSMGPGDTTYATDVTTARSDNDQVVILAEQTPSTSRGARVGAVVGVAALHGTYEERRAGHKFLLPAAESVGPVFINDMRRNIAVVP